jgi:hypothetical protein
VRYQVTNLKVSDILQEDGTPWELDSFCNNTGIQIREGKFRVMRDAVVDASERYRKNSIFDKTTANASTFLCRVKKGSRHIRKILSPAKSDTVPHNIVKFGETTDCFFNNEESPLINGCGGNHFLIMQPEPFCSNFTTIP